MRPIKYFFITNLVFLFLSNYGNCRDNTIPDLTNNSPFCQKLSQDKNLENISLSKPTSELEYLDTTMRLVYLEKLSSKLTQNLMISKNLGKIYNSQSYLSKIKRLCGANVSIGKAALESLNSVFSGLNHSFYKDTDRLKADRKNYLKTIMFALIETIRLQNYQSVLENNKSLRGINLEEDKYDRLLAAIKHKIYVIKEYYPLVNYLGKYTEANYIMTKHTPVLNSVGNFISKLDFLPWVENLDSSPESIIAIKKEFMIRLLADSHIKDFYETENLIYNSHVSIPNMDNKLKIVEYSKSPDVEIKLKGLHDRAYHSVNTYKELFDYIDLADDFSPWYYKKIGDTAVLTVDETLKNLSNVCEMNSCEIFEIDPVTVSYFTTLTRASSGIRNEVNAQVCQCQINGQKQSVNEWDLMANSLTAGVLATSCVMFPPSAPLCLLASIVATRAISLADKNSDDKKINLSKIESLARMRNENLTSENMVHESFQALAESQNDRLWAQVNLMLEYGIITSIVPNTFKSVAKGTIAGNKVDKLFATKARVALLNKIREAGDFKKFRSIMRARYKLDQNQVVLPKKYSVSYFRDALMRYNKNKIPAKYLYGEGSRDTLGIINTLSKKATEVDAAISEKAFKYAEDWIQETLNIHSELDETLYRGFEAGFHEQDILSFFAKEGKVLEWLDFGGGKKVEIPLRYIREYNINGKLQNIIIHEKKTFASYNQFVEFRNESKTIAKTTFAQSFKQEIRRESLLFKVFTEQAELRRKLEFLRDSFMHMPKENMSSRHKLLYKNLIETLDNPKNNPRQMAADFINSAELKSELWESFSLKKWRLQKRENSIFGLDAEAMAALQKGGAFMKWLSLGSIAGAGPIISNIEKKLQRSEALQLLNAYLIVIWNDFNRTTFGDLSEEVDCAKESGRVFSYSLCLIPLLTRHLAVQEARTIVDPNYRIDEDIEAERRENDFLDYMAKLKEKYKGAYMWWHSETVINQKIKEAPSKRLLEIIKESAPGHEALFLRIKELFTVSDIEKLRGLETQLREDYGPEISEIVTMFLNDKSIYENIVNEGQLPSDLKTNAENIFRRYYRKQGIN